MDEGLLKSNPQDNIPLGLCKISRELHLKNDFDGFLLIDQNICQCF